MKKEKAKIIDTIANEYLNIKILKTRHSDELDFYDGLAVWEIKKALNAAFEAGKIFSKNT